MGRTLDAESLKKCFESKISVYVHDINGQLITSGLITNFTDLCDIISVDGEYFDMTQYFISADNLT